MNSRSADFFGPDLAGGPFTSQRIETAALQIAALLAQLRAPLSRSDADIEAHADFVRALADRLAPDWASTLSINNSPEVMDTITTAIRTNVPGSSVLECWLADNRGNGPSSATPTFVDWTAGIVLEEIIPNKHYRILTTDTGMASVSVGYANAHNWYWCVTRGGKVSYSSLLMFQ